MNALCERLASVRRALSTEDPDLPRLASFRHDVDFLRNGLRLARGTFLKCFAETAAAAANEILSGSKVATVFLQFMEDKKEVDFGQQHLS